jgi:hypothetical protein
MVLLSAQGMDVAAIARVGFTSEGAAARRSAIPVGPRWVDWRCERGSQLGFSRTPAWLVVASEASATIWPLSLIAVA